MADEGGKGAALGGRAVGSVVAIEREVHHPRPGRLPGFSYTGCHRYLLTMCARRSSKPFQNAPIVEHVLGQLRACLNDGAFALLAYCFMPDHVHLVVEGLSEQADLRRVVARWKQFSGYWHVREAGEALWMPGYSDRVLRDRESTMDAVRYVVMNRVRAGLARAIGGYPFVGSDAYSSQEIEEILRMKPNCPC